jgi:Ca2+-binding RTX toxin-like protein
VAKTILGDGDDNELTGSGKADRIFGRGGDDDIDAKGGGDTIAAGDGDDFSIRGGKGADMFVFMSGDGQDQVNDFSIKQGDGLDLSLSGFGKEDLKDVDAGGEIKDADGDGYYLRETSSNGKPELQIFFGDDEGGFDQLTLIGVSIAQLVKDVQKNPEHYDFFG